MLTKRLLANAKRLRLIATKSGDAILLENITRALQDSLNPDDFRIWIETVNKQYLPLVKEKPHKLLNHSLINLLQNLEYYYSAENVTSIYPYLNIVKQRLGRAA